MVATTGSRDARGTAPPAVWKTVGASSAAAPSSAPRNRNESSGRPADRGARVVGGMRRDAVTGRPASARPDAGSGRIERDTRTNDSPSSGSRANASRSCSRYQAVKGERSGSWIGRASTTTRVGIKAGAGSAGSSRISLVGAQPAAQLVPAQTKNDGERLEEDGARHFARAQLAVDKDDRDFLDARAGALRAIGRL